MDGPQFLQMPTRTIHASKARAGELDAHVGQTGVVHVGQRLHVLQQYYSVRHGEGGSAVGQHKKGKPLKPPSHLAKDSELSLNKTH